MLVLHLSTVSYVEFLTSTVIKDPKGYFFHFFYFILQCVNIDYWSISVEMQYFTEPFRWKLLLLKKQLIESSHEVVLIPYSCFSYKVKQKASTFFSPCRCTEKRACKDVVRRWPSARPPKPSPEI